MMIWEKLGRTAAGGLVALAFTAAAVAGQALKQQPPAAQSPKADSPIAGNVKVGGFSGNPVTLIAPPIAWAIGSKLLKSL